MNCEGMPVENYRFLPGSWEQLCTDESMKGAFDIIIMSEVLYNQQYYNQLFDLVKHCQMGVSNPQVIIATKTFYFGLGGGRFELDQFLKDNKSTYKMKC